jgi:hypothetical protein
MKFNYLSIHRYIIIYFKKSGFLNLLDETSNAFLPRSAVYFRFLLDTGYLKTQGEGNAFKYAMLEWPAIRVGSALFVTPTGRKHVKGQVENTLITF